MLDGFFFLSRWVVPKLHFYVNSLALEIKGVWFMWVTNMLLGVMWREFFTLSLYLFHIFFYILQRIHVLEAYSVAVGQFIELYSARTNLVIARIYENPWNFQFSNFDGHIVMTLCLVSDYDAERNPSRVPGMNDIFIYLFLTL